jgi:hypothetical protein
MRLGARMMDMVIRSSHLQLRNERCKQMQMPFLVLSLGLLSE